MEIVRKILLTAALSICSFTSISQSQNEKMFICNNVLIYEDIMIYENDTLQNVRFSSVSMREEGIYTEQTLSLLFKNDSLIGADFERNPNFANLITIPMEDSCIINNPVTLEYVNNVVKRTILRLLKSSES